jgi:4-methylaminobutanoate oxidase (formaldehyde-forming)
MSGGYGHTLGGAVGVGPVDKGGEVTTTEYIKSGNYEIEVAGERFPAKASLRPMYDPQLKRVRI